MTTFQRDFACVFLCTLTIFFFGCVFLADPIKIRFLAFNGYCVACYWTCKLSNTRPTDT